VDVTESDGSGHSRQKTTVFDPVTNAATITYYVNGSVSDQTSYDNVSFVTGSNPVAVGDTSSADLSVSATGLSLAASSNCAAGSGSYNLAVALSNPWTLTQARNAAIAAFNAAYPSPTFIAGIYCDGINIQITSGRLAAPSAGNPPLATSNLAVVTQNFLPMQPATGWSYVNGPDQTEGFTGWVAGDGSDPGQPASTCVRYNAVRGDIILPYAGSNGVNTYYLDCIPDTTLPC
jgi:hypothetical protein